MTKYPVDLHVHTRASDGKLPPERVVKLAQQRGVKVLGITDHDTLAGIEPGWPPDGTAVWRSSPP